MYQWGVTFVAFAGDHAVLVFPLASQLNARGRGTVPYIRERTTLADVIAAEPDTIYYGFHTCWWTHREEDVRIKPKNDLPCDPRGGMLMMTPGSKFLAAAMLNPGQYGKHGLDALMAAHNDNCIVTPFDNREACLETWREYNDLLDQQGLQEVGNA